MLLNPERRSLSVMEIKRKEIPEAFLKTLPDGLKFVSKHGHDFLVVESLKCQHGHSLITDEVHIHGEAAIKLRVILNNCKGVLFLDAFWGSHTKLYSFIPHNYEKVEIIDILCPVCNESLLVDESCPDKQCGSKKMVQMCLPNNNRILACASFGCPEHKIEINNVSNQVTEKIDDINFFGIGFEDDVFRGV